MSIFFARDTLRSRSLPYKFQICFLRPHYIKPSTLKIKGIYDQILDGKRGERNKKKLQVAQLREISYKLQEQRTSYKNSLLSLFSRILKLSACNFDSLALISRDKSSQSKSNPSERPLKFAAIEFKCRRQGYKRLKTLTLSLSFSQ